MKPNMERRPGPRWQGSSPRQFFRPRRHWILPLLFVAGWAALLLFGWDELPLVGRVVAVSGLSALSLLLIWWALTGFAGYESRIGLRVVTRVRPPEGGPWWVLGLALVAIAGAWAMHMGLRSPRLAILVAIATLGAISFGLSRRLALSATLCCVGIALGVAALIVVQSVSTGFQHEFERRVLGVYAHINVTRAYGINEYRRFETYLRGVEGVQGASPFVYYAMALAPVPKPGQRSGEVRRASVLVKGIEPLTAAEVIDIDERLVDGMEHPVTVSALVSDTELKPIQDRGPSRLPQVISETPDPRGENWYPEAMARWRAQPASKRRVRARMSLLDDDDDWPDEVEVARNQPELDELPTMFVGITLAQELELSVDDVVMLVDPGASYDHSRPPEFRRYRVAGIFRAGFQEFDTRLIYVHIRELQYFRYNGNDTVSGVDLRLEDLYEAPLIESRLRQAINNDEYTILEWQKLNANLFQSIRTQKSMLTIILSLVAAVAGFNVLAALWTMVMRRMAEIAILMSTGATEAGVARVFQFAGMTLGVVGCLAGVGLGLVLCFLVELYGYTLDPGVYFIERLPVEISAAQISAVVAMTMGIAFVATIPPALRAAKLRPVEGLRHE